MGNLNSEVGMNAENKPYQVGSGNLISVLKGINNEGEIILDFDESDFPSKIRLSWIKNYVDEMYRAQKVGEFWPDTDRKEGEQATEIAQQSRNRVMREAIAHAYKKIAENRDILEESRDIFLDRGTGLVGVTEIIFGSGDSVENTTLDTYKEGFPLLSIHTHPNSQLPTFKDYEKMVLAFDDGKRVISGILVLCPEGQVLALTTKDTPKFKNWTDGIKFIREIGAEQREEAKDEIKEDERAKKTILENYFETVEAKSRLIAEIKKGGNSGNTDKIEGEIRSVKDKAKKDFSAISHFEINKIASVVNNQGIINAKRLGICLYWSTDGENFVKFSA